MLLPEAIIREKLDNELAWTLVEFLIVQDVSWETTSTSYTSGESTLMLATKSGNAKIVEEILRRLPHAVENIDGQGRNILHIAIQHHHIRILDIVEKMEFPMTRLVRKLDYGGNSILHMVGIKATDDKLEDMQTPALLLQENLLLFEDFKQSLPKKLMLGVTLLIISVSTMMLAFVAAVILQIRSKDQWMEFALSGTPRLGEDRDELQPDLTPTATKGRLSRSGDEALRLLLWSVVCECVSTKEISKDTNATTAEARQLAEFLIEKDTSWEATESAMDEKSQEMNEKVAETPLILATKSGCTEIVEEILRKYPQAVEHVDAEGRNILHVAIKYRHIKVFDIVESMGIPMTRLIRKIDDNGNSILHYVGIKAKDHEAEDMRSPAMLLQEHLLLFERVQKVSTIHFIKHFNCDRKTAEEVFADSNIQIHDNAKERLKRTAENCSIVAVLLATVDVAAANTVPGGPNQNTGYPILVNKPFFIIFTMADVLSLTFALTSVITILSIFTFPLKDFKQSLPQKLMLDVTLRFNDDLQVAQFLQGSHRYSVDDIVPLKDSEQSHPQKLMLGVTLLIISVSTMALAFVATVLVQIHSKEQGQKLRCTPLQFT
ncbi:hypothetical protein RJ639_030944 [Escallonia herrerae]|uniref:PGG domain-containing protein n=1 Tax=Escallonia herrerae TaxID=1293975 RepID=A0AA88X1N1_9ASTE|nr:hypothetical protein RJ639_030944 [Escallonia herrerae]